MNDIQKRDHLVQASAQSGFAIKNAISARAELIALSLNSNNPSEMCVEIAKIGDAIATLENAQRLIANQTV